MNFSSNTPKTSKNEQGSVLLTSLIMLLLLTLIGVSGMNISSTDIEISGNYRVYKENLMRADGLAMRAAKLKYLDEIDYSSVYDSNNLSDDYFVDATDKPNVINNINATKVREDWNSTNGYMMFIDAYNPDIYVVFGRSRQNNGDAIVEIAVQKEEDS